MSAQQGKNTSKLPSLETWNPKITTSKKNFIFQTPNFGVPPISFRGSVVVAFNQLSVNLWRSSCSRVREDTRDAIAQSVGGKLRQGVGFSDSRWQDVVGQKKHPHPPQSFFILGGNRSVVSPPKKITHHPLDLPIFFDTFYGKNGDPKSLRSSIDAAGVTKNPGVLICVSVDFLFPQAWKQIRMFSWFLLILHRRYLVVTYVPAFVIYTYCFSPHDFFLNKNIKKAQRHLCIFMRRLPQKWAAMPWRGTLPRRHLASAKQTFPGAWRNAWTISPERRVTMQWSVKKLVGWVVTAIRPTAAQKGWSPALIRHGPEPYPT